MRVRFVVALAMLFMASHAIAAPTTSPRPVLPASAPTKTGSTLGKQPIPHSTSAPGDRAGTSTGGAVGLDAKRVALALGVVLALIFGLRYAARRFLSIPKMGAASGAISVLARTTIAPRQQLLLIQVGRRLVLVANSGAQMNPLCEIRDEDEIAQLLSQLRKGKGESSTFPAMLGRAGSEYEKTGDGDETHDGDGNGDAAAGVDPAVATTKEELSGLAEKVRQLSKSFERT